MIASHGILRMRNFCDRSCVENVLEIIWKNVVEPDRPHMSVYDNMAHALCVLDN